MLASAGSPAAPVVGAGTVRKAELLISTVLRGGVLVSGAIILGGLAYFFLAKFSGHLLVLSFPHTLPTVFHALARGEPLAVIALGLLVLLATPVLRVMVSCAGRWPGAADGDGVAQPARLRRR